MSDQNPTEENSIAAEIIEKADPPVQRKRVTLEELLEGIPEGAHFEEIDWGPARGAEVWWT